MNSVAWDIEHQYQPTSTACSPTALSILLGHYEDSIGPLEIEKVVPQCVDDNGQKMGTINQSLAVWCLERGYKVEMHTFDCQVIDQSWSKLDKQELQEKLKLRANGWVVPSLGKEWTKQYVDSYASFLESGGKLNIKQAVTTGLLYDLLKKGPILPCVSYGTIYGEKRTRVDSDTEAIPDDIKGRATNHSIVVYGYEENGDFLVADPWKKPGLHKVEPEVMLAAISTAQIECDNLLFQVSKTV